MVNNLIFPCGCHTLHFTDIAATPQSMTMPPEVVSSLTLKIDADSQIPPTSEDPSSAEQSRSPSPAPENNVGAQACSLCSLTFVTVQDQRGHLRSDLHQYNLKQKLRGLKAVSEADFEKLITDLDESLSGSDSTETDEEDDEAARKETTLSALLKKQATLAERNRSGNDAAEDDEWTQKKKRGTGKPPLLWFSSPCSRRIPTTACTGRSLPPKS